MPLDDIAVHRKPLALLAVLASEGTASRDRLMMLLWSDSDTARARGSLKQAIHVLRTHLNASDLLLGTAELRLNPEIIDSDVRQLSRALDAGDFERAAGLYGGRFLGGVHIGAGVEFEQWTQSHGIELERRYRETLERLATTANAAGQTAQAAEWWRRLQVIDPTNGRVALHLMEALEASGQRAAALQHARVYELLMREEFGLPVDSAVTELAERLQRSPAPPRPAREPDERRSPSANVEAPAGTAHAWEPHLDGGQATSAPPRRARRLPPVMTIGGGVAALLVVAGLWAWGPLDARPGVADSSDTAGGRQAAASNGPSIAVLPFVDMSPNGDHEYLGDGLAEDLSARLTEIEGLRVAARTSAFQYKGAGADIRTVGSNLGVATVLEGSVRRSGDRVRVTAQLIESRTGYHLWSATYETDIADVFAIEDTIGRAIANTLRVRLASTAPRSAERGRAYDAYLRGRYHLRQHTRDGTRLAAEAFNEAIALDSTFAKAYAGLADVEFSPLTSAPGPRFRRARDAAGRALALDDRLAEAHASLGWALMWYDRDWEGAARHLQRARELDPTFSQAINWSSARLAALDSVEASLDLIRQAYERSPSPATACFVAVRLQWLGRLDEAIAYYRSAMVQDSTLFMARWGMGLVYLEQRRFDEAIAEFRRPGGDYLGVFQDGYLGYAYGVAGRSAEANEVLARMRQRIGRGEYVSPTDVALVYIGLGDTERALEWMDRHELDRGARVFLLANPLYEPLRGEPRFRRLLDRLGLGAAGSHQDRR